MADPAFTEGKIAGALIGQIGRKASLRAQCPFGGPVPCIDDLCHGVSWTLCALEEGVDFCEHGNVPDYCDDCGDTTMRSGPTAINPVTRLRWLILAGRA